MYTLLESTKRLLVLHNATKMRTGVVKLSGQTCAPTTVAADAANVYQVHHAPMDTKVICSITGGDGAAVIAPLQISRASAKWVAMEEMPGVVIYSI